MGTRFAAISDVHGNRWALEAVLADIGRLGIGTIVNLGDSLWGPLDPAGTAGLLMELDPLSVSGNEDRIVVAPDPKTAATATWRFVSSQLGARHLEWLRRQAVTAVAADGQVLLFHGTPRRDDEYLLETVGPAGAAPRPPAEVDAILDAAAEALVLCGHSHVPRTVRLPSGRLAVNCGSVGLQAYDDDAPFFHVMQNGTPQARYAVIEKTPSGWTAEQRRVDYDWEAAAAAARRNGRPDWAGWLRTGRAG